MAASDRRRFLRSFLAHPRRVGAVLPTSRRAVRDLLDMTSFDGVRTVVELGAGTGVYTREIVPRLPTESRFLAFEIDPDLAAELDAEMHDPRVSVVAGSAERLSEHLEGVRADVIVSAIPFTSLPAGPRKAILDEAARALADGGTFLVLQYSPLVGKELRKRFATIDRRISPINVPPAVLFACREAIDGASVSA